ncbi:hypothetical protein F7P69_08640 [Cellulosimicrobium funkei]|nr:hypothetical protein [Cellulosimicrobium funkei]
MEQLLTTDRGDPQRLHEIEERGGFRAISPLEGVSRCDGHREWFEGQDIREGEMERVSEDRAETGPVGQIH